MLSFLKQKFKRKKKSIAISGHNFDYAGSANTIEYWDGDSGLSSASWVGRKVPHTITFLNSPTYNASGLNGHGTITFNGTNQRGLVTTPVISQPLSQYIVLNQINWTLGKYLFEDGSTADNITCIQTPSNEDFTVRNFTTGDEFVRNNNLGSWFVLAMVLNGSNSTCKINLGFSEKRDFGTDAIRGINLASNLGLSEFANCSFAYIIKRNVADNIGIQTSIIKQLQIRFAI